MQNVQFSPSEVSKLFGVNESTIKRWVDKGFLEAQVTSGGHRRISQKQLADFVSKNQQYAKSSYVLRRLGAVNNFTKKDSDHFYKMLKGNRIRQAERMLSELFLMTQNLPELLDGVVSPALRKIGQEWRDGKISIYEEHRMSFLIRLMLIQLSQYIPEPPGKKKAVLACVPGDRHEIALQMLSLILKDRGYVSHILGTNIPYKEVVKAVEETGAGHVLITRVYSDQASTRYIANLANYAEKNNKTLFYGGSGWPKNLQTKRWKSEKIAFFCNLKDFCKAL